MTLSARWVEKFCEVKFVNEDGSLIESLSVGYGNKLVKPADPENGDFPFMGWYLGDEEWSFYDGVVTDDITLTARYNKLMHTVKFVNGSGSVIHTAKVVDGGKVTPIDIGNDDNKTFLGWFTNGMVFDFEETEITRDYVLTPRWIAYVVYFLDGGVNDAGNPSIISSEEVISTRIS